MRDVRIARRDMMLMKIGIALVCVIGLGFSI
jgi:hypothetical protein